MTVSQSRAKAHAYLQDKPEVRLLLRQHKKWRHKTAIDQVTDEPVNVPTAKQAKLRKENSTVPMLGEQDKTRFQSFAERYVIERASTFREGRELEDAWACIMMARSVYRQIHGVTATLGQPPEGSPF